MAETPDEPEEPVRVQVEQLQPGVFISLTERWLDHPFLFNEFRISNERQIRTLHELGMDSVLYYPSRSTAEPLPLPETPQAAPPPRTAPTPSAEDLAEREARLARIARVAAVRERLARCEKAYGNTAGAIRKTMQGLHATPHQSAEMAREVVSETVAGLLADESVVLGLISRGRRDNSYFHALNVMILSLLLGESAGLDERVLHDIGLGALFHDLGKLKIPAKVLKKGNERNRAEEDFFRLHTIYGEQIATETGLLTPAARDILRHHHERADGSGFPDGLTLDAIRIGARIVAIANRYDNLCNAPENGGLTPAEALSQMYVKESHWWDQALLARFIKQLGVFPPGSIVHLSNGTLGLVVAVNRADLLRPSVLIYDPSVPRKEANIVDLVDAPEVSIEKAERRDHVDTEVLEYLAPRHQVIYFYDSHRDSGEKNEAR